MTISLAAVLVPVALLSVGPRAGAEFRGTIEFPRAQQMTLQVAGGSRLIARLGFDGRCSGGGLGEVWVSEVPARPALRLRGTGFSGKLRGTSRNLGGVRGRTGTFSWRIVGRFTDRTTATATVTGRAEVRSGRRVISRCRISSPAPVTLSRTRT